VAAKTGTAQLNDTGEPERSHAWIVAFAPANEPRYAVAVMLKGTNAEISSSTGGRLAGPIAKTVLDAAMAIPA
jgi:peptidoglycan glycosyltransferase